MLMHTHWGAFSWCPVGWSNMRFLQHSCWQQRSPEMWWCATGWVIPPFFDGLFWLHDHGQATLLDCLTAHPETQCHIPENVYLLPDILIFIFKPRTNHYSPLHTSSSYNFITSLLLKNAFITRYFSQIQLAFQRAVVSHCIAHSPNPCICTSTVHNDSVAASNYNCLLQHYHVNGGSRSS